MGTVISAGIATMNTVRSMFAGAALLALPAEAQEHRFEDDPVVMVRENFVACDVLSQLQRVQQETGVAGRIGSCRSRPRFGVINKSLPRGTNDHAAGLKGMTW